MDKEQVTAGMNDIEVKQDLYRLHKLEKEYNDLSDKCNKLYTFIYSLDFADKVRNIDERILLQEQHKRMEAYRTNLYQRIQFYRNLIAVSNGYDIFTPWCEVAEKIDQEAVESAAHHCGQDCDCDDACCQAGSPCGRPKNKGYRDLVEGLGIHIHDGNIPLEEWGDLINLRGMQVIGITKNKCQSCPQDHHGVACVKLELVGGYFLCLAPIPNTVTE